MRTHTNFAYGWNLKRLFGSMLCFSALTFSAMATVPNMTDGDALIPTSSGCECVPLKSTVSPFTARAFSMTRLVRSTMVCRSSVVLFFASYMVTRSTKKVC